MKCPLCKEEHNIELPCEALNNDLVYDDTAEDMRTFWDYIIDLEDPK